MNVQLRDRSTAIPASLVSQASFWLPDLLTCSAWTEHAPFGFWITEALKPRCVVELGVHHGFSYFVFCQAVARLGIDARCFAVDTWVGDEHAGFYGDEVYEAACAHNRRYESFSRLIRSDFSDACGQFADGSIDLLHIDGCHRYEIARRDFQSWLPKMSSRGVVLFHDTAEYGNGFGVYRLWEELSRQYPHFEFTHGHGLGIVAVGSNPPAKMGALFGTSVGLASTHAVRAEYERLGVSVANYQRLAEQRDEIEHLRWQVARLESVVAGYESSTSWRVTAPLRAVAGPVNRIGGVAKKLRDTLREAVDHAAGPAEPVFRADH